MAFAATLPLTGRSRWWAVVLTAALAAGCTHTDWLHNKDDGPPGTGTPCQIVTVWQNRVVFAADPTKNGTPGPGLAGRLYLFGPEVSHPMVGDGSLVVELYDESSGQPEALERWEIDPTTLHRLMKPDMIGLGYTVYLPWRSYRAEVTRLRLKSRYQPGKGAPLFTESAVTLAAMNGVARVSSTSTPLSGSGK
jgi:hypothetical protein